MIRHEELLDAARDGLAGGVEAADGGGCAVRARLAVQRPGPRRTTRRTIGNRTESTVTRSGAIKYIVRNVWQVVRSDTARFSTDAQDAFRSGARMEKTMFIEVDAVPR